MLSKADKDYINEAIVAGIAVALAQVTRPAESAPAAHATASEADPEAGLGYKARRAFAVAHRTAGRYCAACKVGFAFPKDACTRCGKAL